MDYVDYSFCRSCFQRSLITQSCIEHNGNVGACTGCGTKVVLHECVQAPTELQSVWLPVLEHGISAVCPTCGIVIRVGRTVASTPELPEWIRSLGAAAVVGAVVFGTGILIDRLLEELQA